MLSKRWAISARRVARQPMVITVTDFGTAGPYLGQVHAAILRAAPEVVPVVAPGVVVIDLLADAPAWDPQATAYLLAAYCRAFPANSVFLCVVDPGVGSAREACVVRADGQWFVGPANGLFELVQRRARQPVRCWRIEVAATAQLSATFHGRDLFAPIAARLAAGRVPGALRPVAEIGRSRDWPDDLARIVYIDVYGNAISGVRAATVGSEAIVHIGGQSLRQARTFADVPPGQCFWYENSNGLLEIAANQARADKRLSLAIGTPLTIENRG